MSEQATELPLQKTISSLKDIVKGKQTVLNKRKLMTREEQYISLMRGVNCFCHDCIMVIILHHILCLEDDIYGLFFIWIFPPQPLILKVANCLKGFAYNNIKCNDDWPSGKKIILFLYTQNCFMPYLIQILARSRPDIGQIQGNLGTTEGARPDLIHSLASDQNLTEIWLRSGLDMAHIWRSGQDLTKICLRSGNQGKSVLRFYLSM